MSAELELPPYRPIYDVRGMDFAPVLSQQDCPHCSTTARCPIHEAMFQNPIRSHAPEGTTSWTKKKGLPRRKPADYDKSNGFVVNDNEADGSFQNDTEGIEPTMNDSEEQRQARQDHKREKELMNALTRMTIASKKERTIRRKKETMLSNDPERLRRQQEHQERAEVRKARRKAKIEGRSQARDRQASQKAQKHAQRKAEVNIALEQARAEAQRLAAERRAEKTRIGTLKAEQHNQQGTDVGQQELEQDGDCLVAVNDQSVKHTDFLVRAYELLKEAFEEQMSRKAKNNLEEALTLVQTSILLGSGVPVNDGVSRGIQLNNRGGAFQHNVKNEMVQQNNENEMVQQNNESVQQDGMEEDL